VKAPELVKGAGPRKAKDGAGVDEQRGGLPGIATERRGEETRNSVESVKESLGVNVPVE
jgi:hypothetical protein